MPMRGLGGLSGFINLDQCLRQSSGDWTDVLFSLRPVMRHYADQPINWPIADAS